MTFKSKFNEGFILFQPHVGQSQTSAQLPAAFNCDELILCA